MTIQSTGIVGRYFAIKRAARPDDVNTTITAAITLVAALTADDAIDSRCSIGSPVLLIIRLKYTAWLKTFSASTAILQTKNSNTMLREIMSPYNGLLLFLVMGQYCCMTNSIAAA
jgi:hypothetical protein